MFAERQHPYIQLKETTTRTSKISFIKSWHWQTKLAKFCKIDIQVIVTDSHRTETQLMQQSQSIFGSVEFSENSRSCIQLKFQPCLITYNEQLKLTCVDGTSRWPRRRFPWEGRRFPWRPWTGQSRSPRRPTWWRQWCPPAPLWPGPGPGSCWQTSTQRWAGSLHHWWKLQLDPAEKCRVLPVPGNFSGTGFGTRAMFASSKSEEAKSTGNTKN